MANAILAKPATGGQTALTISLASLASSTAGVGRQSTIVDNTSLRYQRLYINAKIKLGTSPTGSKGVYLYLIRDDGNGVRDDAAGASDAALTVLNCPLIGTLADKAAPATGDVLQRTFVVENPGPKWGVAVVHDTVAALDSTGGNHVIGYVGENPEVQ